MDPRLTSNSSSYTCLLNAGMQALQEDVQDPRQALGDAILRDFPYFCDPPRD